MAILAAMRCVEKRVAEMKRNGPIRLNLSLVNITRFWETLLFVLNTTQTEH